MCGLERLACSLKLADRFKVPEPLDWFVMRCLEPCQTRLVLVMVDTTELFDSTAPIGCWRKRFLK